MEIESRKILMFCNDLISLASQDAHLYVAGMDQKIRIDRIMYASNNIFLLKELLHNLTTV